MKTYAFIGASGRALNMYAKPMLSDYPETVKIVGVFDINPGRAKNFVAECNGSFPVFEDFEEMMAATKPDVVIVTTTDVYHSDYIIRAMELGADVITEKPMTTTDDRIRAILEAEQRTGKKVTVTFNYRYMPIMTKIKELVKDGAIGDVLSVHFEWLLTQNMDYKAHGTSYFRRWNARMALSSGLLVHKSTHHFDLINWIIDDEPKSVAAFGKLRMYGAKNSPWSDVPSEGLTCRTCLHASECKYCYRISEFEERHYAAQESFDAKTPNASISLKDNCIYASDIDIYDTMSATVEYKKGALLSYSLNATTPYEGWKMVINGKNGRIESCEFETGPQSKDVFNYINVFDLKDNITTYKLVKPTTSHGGGDIKLRDKLFLENVLDPLGHSAGSKDGAYSVIIGVAANKSIKEHKVIDVEDLLH